MRRFLGRLLQIIGVIAVVLVALIVLLVVFVDPAEEGEGSRGAEMHGLSYSVVRVKQAPARKGTISTERARGVFVFVTVDVKNVGDEPAALLVDPQFVGGNGKEYTAADIDAENALGALLTGGWPIELQPDFSQRATLIFDVARAAVRRARVRLEACEVEVVTEETFRKHSCEDAELDLGLS